MPHGQEGRLAPLLFAFVCFVDVFIDLVDDELDLPAKLPGNVRYQGLKRKPTSRKQRQ